MTSGQTFGQLHAALTAEVRLAQEDDLPALEWLGLYTPHRDIIHAAFEAQQRGDALLFLAVSAGYPIAQVWVDLAESREQQVAVLWAIRTFYPLQGLGLGQQLMAVVEAELARRGLRSAELDVEPDHAAAMRFYHRRGYRERPTGRAHPSGRHRLGKPLAATPLGGKPAIGNLTPGS